MQHDTQTRPDPAADPGRQQWQQTPHRRSDLPYKQAWLAGFLSGIFPGVGQLYVGYYRQAITVGVIFIALITGVSSEAVPGLEPFFGMSIGFCWLFGIIDASRRAQAINRALDGYGDQPLPADMELPGGGGSTAGGAALVVLGVVLVANTAFDVSLDWLQDWWPLVLVGFGAWLMVKARQDKDAAK